jgi:hypothetical protein
MSPAIVGAVRSGPLDLCIEVLTHRGCGQEGVQGRFRQFAVMIISNLLTSTATSSARAPLDMTYRRSPSNTDRFTHTGPNVVGPSRAIEVQPQMDGAPRQPRLRRGGRRGLVRPAALRIAPCRTVANVLSTGLIVRRCNQLPSREVARPGWFAPGPPAGPMYSRP